MNISLYFNEWCPQSQYLKNDHARRDSFLESRLPLHQIGGNRSSAVVNHWFRRGFQIPCERVGID